ncbi:MAG: Rrf2 family transcriptional regulator [Elusimicrobia bacterium]|nr:Rrf2 family transcriptional regulator [Elusimicrobiota bacterium]
MNLLNRSTDYAVRSLIFMANDPDQVTSTAEVEKALMLPRPFLRRIFQALEKAGYLTSIKGHRGGFAMARRPDEIRLFDLMVLFQGEVSFGDCLFRKKICSCVKTCPLRREIKRMESGVLVRLKKLTLQNLLRDSAGKRGTGA